MTDRTDRFYSSLLVVRCQTGDQAAFEELVCLYQPRLRYFVHKIIHDANRVDDLLQDVWFDVFRGVARLADPGAFRAWLYQIARRRSFCALRKQGQTPCSLEAIDPPAPDSEEEEFSAEDAEEVHRVLDELAAGHREVLLLRFVQDMNYEEIAQVIGCPLGTVRSKLYYAKRALRRAIEGRKKDE